MHLDLDDAVALTVLAAAALHVETEAARLVAAHTRFRHLREQVSDVGEDAGVGRRVRTRRSADRRLVDVDDLVDEGEARNLAGDAGALFRPVEVLGHPAIENVAHQRAFPGAADPRNADQLAQREVHIDVLQVVFGRPSDDEHRAVPLAPAAWQRNRALTA